MVAVSCTSCSATPTPASLVADEVKKGELGSKQGNGLSSDKNSAPEKTISNGKNSDSVYISDAARQRLAQSVQGITDVSAPAALDIYSKPKASNT